MDTILLGTDGSRLFGVTRSFRAPRELHVPVLDTAAAFGARPRRMQFGARVFRLHRVTAADHLGPTEAEYREVER